MSYTKYVVSCVKIILDEAKSFSLLKIIGNDVVLGENLLDTVRYWWYSIHYPANVYAYKNCTVTVKVISNVNRCMYE